MSAIPQRKIAHTVYSKPMLSIYDLVVIWFGNRFVTRCASEKMLAFYNQNISDNHLEVGVGTGYFLDRCRFPVLQPRLALMDINRNSLQKTQRRIARYNPEVYQQDVLSPITVNCPKFTSVGCNYLLHCLPGAIHQKAVLFEHLKGMLKSGGILFGSTILFNGSDASMLSKLVMYVYNLTGIFSNMEDDVAGLQSALQQHFSDYSIMVCGSAALFWAKV